MNPVSPSPKEEVIQLCDRMLDDASFDVKDRERLERLVIDDPTARRAYVEYMQLQSLLGDVRFKDSSLAEVVNFPVSVPTKRGRRHWSGRWGQGMAAAAAVVILAAGWGMGRWQGQKAVTALSGPVVAKLVDVKGARWDGGSLPTEVGAVLSTGRLRLAAGLATLEFEKGARLTLEGPADLELLSAERCYLHSGALVAHVPPPAVGFMVETAHARLIDHGTDFGISTGVDGQAQVQVFQGEVELQHHRSGEKVNLLTRQAARITEEDLSRSGGDLESERPDTRRVVPEEADVVTLTTNSGRGQAAYVWSPDTKTHFSDTLLLLKHTAQVACRRKAWLGFDLSLLQGREVRSASLTLQFEPTGWGYASLLPDCEFSVYGVTDDTLDAWTKETINWENAPGNDPKSAGADLSKAVKLGSFTIPRGDVAGAFSIRGEELARFLTNDKNLYATLVVVRETPENVGGGLVHGFAGNNHPTLKAPTLRLVLD